MQQPFDRLLQPTTCLCPHLFPPAVVRSREKTRRHSTFRYCRDSKGHTCHVQNPSGCSLLIKIFQTYGAPTPNFRWASPVIILIAVQKVCSTKVCGSKWFRLKGTCMLLRSNCSVGAYTFQHEPLCTTHFCTTHRLYHNFSSLGRLRQAGSSFLLFLPSLRRLDR